MIKSLLKINGVDYTGQILTPFEVERNKLWDSDTGRVMSGDMKGTLIGIFPKVKVSFFPKTNSEMAALLKVLDSPHQLISYYELKYQGMVELGTYTNDYSYQILSLDPFYGEVKASFISEKGEK